MTDHTPEHVLLSLPSEDLDLVTALVLEGSSLKGLAARYGVSYPTIRGRFDRVIKRLKHAVAGEQIDPLRDLVANLVERGELGGSAARRILDAADTRNHNTEKN
jgi:hypothetical protein